MPISTGANLPALTSEHIRQAVVKRAATGRPSKFNANVAAEIIVRMIGGESVRSIGRDPDMPTDSTIYDWRDRIPAFAEQFARASALQASGFVHEGLEILDNCDDTAMSKVRKAEARANYRLSLAKCYDRETYGDKVQQDVNVKGVVIQTSCRELQDLLDGKG
jgi:hypothetical protein